MMAARRRDNARDVALSWLLHDLAAVPVNLDRQIADVTLDSRDVTRGSLFIALPGTQTDGLKFAHQALDHGAAAIVHAGTLHEPVHRELEKSGVPLIAVTDLAARAGLIASRFHGAPSEALRLIGVTGTDGKTSVSHLLAQVLDREPARCGLLGTLGYGRVSDLRPFGLTTPDAVTLQARLAEFVGAGLGDAVMEVSSHALAQHRVGGCHFTLAVLTNLGRDHLDYHGDLDTYAQAKTRLFQTPDLGAAVLNMDDPFSAALLETLQPAARVFGYSQTRATLPGVTTLRAARLAASADGIDIELAAPFSGQRLRVPLLGDFNAMNALAVAAALLALDWSMTRIADALADCDPIPGRMERVPTALPGRVIVDYAHTPQALHRALLALRPLTGGRLWCVFGCGGDRDRGKRPLMGEVAEAHADAVIVTDDNPRGEDPAAIVAEILSGMQHPDSALVCQPRESAIRTALQRATAGDCVLIAGKGHESHQLIGEQRLVFDDRIVVRELAGELSA